MPKNKYKETVEAVRRWWTNDWGGLYIADNEGDASRVEAKCRELDEILGTTDADFCED